MDLMRVTPIKRDFEESEVGGLKLLLKTLVTFIGKLSPLVVVTLRAEAEDRRASAGRVGCGIPPL